MNRRYGERYQIQVSFPVTQPNDCCKEVGWLRKLMRLKETVSSNDYASDQ
jgi:hypothetical protein